MLQLIPSILAHHEAHDQPFWLVLVAATVLFAAAVVLRRQQ